MPGLWDAHSHENMDQPFAGNRRDRMELAMGVTSEISMGDEAYHSLEQVESQQSGATLGPRYFWGGRADRRPSASSTAGCAPTRI